MQLNDLVEAIMSSVASAQNEIERQNIQNLSQYFNKDGEPEMVTVRLPSASAHLHAVGDNSPGQSQGGDGYQEIDIPLLTLFQVNPVKIKEMSVNFNISLNAVEEIEQAAAEDDKTNDLLHTSTSKIMKKARKKKFMSTDLFAGSLFGRGKNRNAEVKITFESGEPPEGYLKLNSHLLKLF
ncbi:DUF2589 domain-containing protein [Thalassomonas viridans]|uniref:DUF2589 domain-containing protein n=1 Tax=Thalassomonas viridans TaxID=137584 RepID=A0AAE9Z5N5_9GAMM|nr:DUF2589 domain-containing protein [Thalassomonas viridans]WDE06534.1 DUF2589 domain-containing protein [Thalassomonas viridans]